MEGSQVEKAKNIQYYIKNQDFFFFKKKKHLGQNKNAESNLVFSDCSFDLKQTQHHSTEPTIHMSVYRRTKQA